MVPVPVRAERSGIAAESKHEPFDTTQDKLRGIAAESKHEPFDTAQDKLRSGSCGVEASRRLLSGTVHVSTPLRYAQHERWRGCTTLPAS